MKLLRAAALALAVLALWTLLAAPAALAQDAKPAEAPAAAAPSDGIKFGLYAIGVGLIMAAGAIGTGLAQKSIGAAVVGAVAEDRKNLGTGLILIALPETILFICAGFAYLLMGKLG